MVILHFLNAADPDAIPPVNPGAFVPVYVMPESGLVTNRNAPGRTFVGRAIEVRSGVVAVVVNDLRVPRP